MTFLDNSPNSFLLFNKNAFQRCFFFNRLRSWSQIRNVPMSQWTWTHKKPQTVSVWPQSSVVDPQCCSDSTMFGVVLFFMVKQWCYLYGYCWFHSMVPSFDYTAAVKYTIICCKKSQKRCIGDMGDITSKCWIHATVHSHAMSICGYILETDFLSMACCSAGILLNIPLAPVALSQLSTCLSKAAATEKQRRCCCDYNREINRLIYFLTTDGSELIIRW